VFVPLVSMASIIVLHFTILAKDCSQLKQLTSIPPLTSDLYQDKCVEPMLSHVYA